MQITLSSIPDELERALKERAAAEQKSLEAAVLTNRYADMDAGDPAVIQRFESAEEIWLPLIALGELYAGFELGDRKDQNEEQLSDFLSQPTVDVLYPNEDTALQHGEIFAHLRRQGTPIPTNDIWIAGLALQYDLTLDTRDDHFKRVPGLRLHS